MPRIRFSQTLPGSDSQKKSGQFGTSETSTDERNFNKLHNTESPVPCLRYRLPGTQGKFSSWRFVAASGYAYTKTMRSFIGKAFGGVAAKMSNVIPRRKVVHANDLSGSSRTDLCGSNLSAGTGLSESSCFGVTAVGSSISDPQASAVGSAPGFSISQDAINAAATANTAETGSLIARRAKKHGHAVLPTLSANARRRRSLGETSLSGGSDNATPCVNLRTLEFAVSNILPPDIARYVEEDVELAIAFR